jgi:UPF0755 protein
MSETFLSDVVDGGAHGPRRRSQRAAVKRRRRRRRRTWVSVLVVLAVVVGGTFGAWRYGLQPLLASINEPDDYAGPGTGETTVTIPDGATGAAIGTLLKDAGVVKSGKAFVSAYNANSQAGGIQAGTYRLRQQMSAAAAVQALIDTEARLTTKVTLREGLRLTQIVDQLAKDTKIPRTQFTAALKDPESLGLPASAKGVAEGYLFPATYEIEPDETAAQILGRLVQRTSQALEEAGVPEARHHEVLTKASLVQAEAGRPEDFPKVARVVENRLAIKMKLQFDTTVALRDEEVQALHVERGPQGQVAVQHVHRARAARRPDQQSGQRGDRGGDAAVGGQLGVLRHHRPGHGSDQVHELRRAVRRVHGRIPGVAEAESRQVTAAPPAVGPRRAAVLGSPIAHSLSPALHRAAYAALGLDGWRYDAVEVTEDELAGFVRGLDRSWAGLSLTMPLKRAVLPLLAGRSPLAAAVGAVNTVTFPGGAPHGDNTDVHGIVAALTAAGVQRADGVGAATLLGGGAHGGLRDRGAARAGLCTEPVVHVRDPARSATCRGRRPPRGPPRARRRSMPPRSRPSLHPQDGAPAPRAPLHGAAGAADALAPALARARPLAGTDHPGPGSTWLYGAVAHRARDGRRSRRVAGRRRPRDASCTRPRSRSG